MSLETSPVPGEPPDPDRSGRPEGRREEAVRLDDLRCNERIDRRRVTLTEGLATFLPVGDTGAPTTPHTGAHERGRALDHM
jgi:hypothetical protein